MQVRTGPMRSLTKDFEVNMLVTIMILVDYDKQVTTMIERLVIVEVVDEQALYLQNISWKDTQPYHGSQDSTNWLSSKKT